MQVIRDGVPEDIRMRPVQMEYYNPQGIQFAAGTGVGRSAVEAFRYSVYRAVYGQGISMMIAGQLSARATERTYRDRNR